MKVYLASPFFLDGETAYVSEAERILRNKGLDVFSPREHKVKDGESMSNELWGKAVFSMDLDELFKCDLMVVLYHGLYSDSGTAWECGCAYGLNKPSVLVVLDKEAHQSVMLVNGTTHIVDGLDGLRDCNFYDLKSNNRIVGLEQK